ncbi:hypothetical protein [Aequorivita marisscotiae]|uniref:Peptidase M43 pregnancy-associated plasma-A domain-containing protein n=1 Tax=Aequorivita marisscotiae TaxID=3040348 RepID=A0ABY8KU94_9FLAO|nr:hypothetical protein [Aequorivita sp. Ant34-E75]WGF92528.1 hypothetical protein QCQ61_15140 [Aequorivita sp. Ant34-E75]
MFILNLNVALPVIVFNDTTKTSSPPDISTPLCVNISFHIVRNSNGSGGFPSQSLEYIIDNLNAVYDPFNIYLNNNGFNYINSSTYYNLNDINYDNLVQTNNDPNAINFYLVNYASFKGKAGILSNYLVVVNQYALETTAAHELGHSLNLFHTHHSSTCETLNACAEAINGTNCTICGDYICDTPADPCLFNQVNSNCVYIGGGGYSPDTGNTMSYSLEQCRQTIHFKRNLGKSIRTRNHFTESKSYFCTCSRWSQSLDFKCKSNGYKFMWDFYKIFYSRRWR